MTLEEGQKDKILQLIKDHIGKEGNCRVGWAIKVIAGKDFERSLPNIEKIANTIIQSGEYIKEMSMQTLNDFNILKNPEHKFKRFNRHSVIINTIISILTFLAMIVTILFATRTYQTGKLSEQQVKPLTDYSSKTDKKANLSIDSLSRGRSDSALTRGTGKK